MAIYRMISSGSFEPDVIEAMTAAYERALINLAMKRNDPLTELVAKTIINVTATGEREPVTITELALHVLGVVRTAA
jgi:hypothetical protein